MLRIDEKEYFIDRKRFSRPSGRGDVFLYRVNLRTWIELVALSQAMESEKSRQRFTALQMEFLRLTTNIRNPKNSDLPLFPEAYRFNFPATEEDEEEAGEHALAEARDHLFQNLYQTIAPLLNQGMPLQTILDEMNLFQVLIRSNSLEREKWRHYAELLRIQANRNEPRELLSHYQSLEGSNSKIFQSLSEAAKFARKRAAKKRKEKNHAR